MPGVVLYKNKTATHTKQFACSPTKDLATSRLTDVRRSRPRLAFH